MDENIMKEIFRLVIDILMAVCEILWKKPKWFLQRVWDVFFGMSDVSSREQSPEPKVWGDTGEDTWPTTPEAPREIKLEPESKPEPKPEPETEAESEPVPEPVQKQELPRETEAKAYPLPPPSIPELPDGYGDNRLVLMVRDPLWLFTYWEIRKDVLKGVLNTLGPLAHRSKAVIRLYDVTDIIFNGNNAHHRFDTDVALESKNWYLHVGLPDRVFCAEIGILTANGTFRILARSNTVRTPRTTVSDVIDEKWMSIDSLYEKVFVPMDFSVSEVVFIRAEGRSPEEPATHSSSFDHFSSLAALKK
jgi:hypothetical protein